MVLAPCLISASAYMVLCCEPKRVCLLLEAVLLLFLLEAATLCVLA